MNVVLLKNWTAQPIHCPFCGEPLWPDESSSCQHLLYIHSGFLIGELAERVEPLLDLTDAEKEDFPDLQTSTIKRIGGFDTIRQLCDKAFYNLTEFHIDSVHDLGIIGFASMEEELVYWGHKHQSPYK